jgi:uncharacterized protein (DUF302 family)
MTVVLEATASPHPVAETIDRLVAALEKRDVTVFARIDHAAGARAAGLELPDEELLIFGNPRVGTPLMQSDPTAGYELPLRVLAWDDGGQTMIGYRPPTELGEEFRLADRAEVLEKLDGLLAQLVVEATTPA